MGAAAFVAWSEAGSVDTRYELLDGHVYAMASERAEHARAKNAVLRQLERGIAAGALSCEAFPDGMAVQVDEANVFEPDVTVRCGASLPGNTILIEDPVIVVEVASPSTQRVDVFVKLARYFRNPSIQHYLIVVPAGRVVVHHRRVEDRIESASRDAGVIRLDPPGLEIDVTRLFSAELPTAATPAP